MSIKVSISDCRAGAEPKFFEGKNNSAVARVSVAHNERTTNEPGTTKDETRWFQLVGFGAAAHFLKDNVSKGSLLAITDAELHYGRAFEDKSGQTRVPDELHIVHGRGAKVELKEVAGSRQDQVETPAPAA